LWIPLTSIQIGALQTETKAGQVTVMLFVYKKHVSMHVTLANSTVYL